MDEDEVFYLREYKKHQAGDPYTKGGTYDLITNFKKPVNRKGKPEYWYKEKAIAQMAEELGMFLPTKSVYVVPVPTSKQKDDVDYDNRLVQVLEQVARANPKIIPLDVFDCIETCQPSHLGGSRNPEEIRTNLRVAPLPQPCSIVVLVDDVLLSGAHFAACKAMILEQSPQTRVVGAFWARAIS